MYVNEDYALKYGLNEAILIEYFRYWINHNKQQGMNQIDGRTWSYSSFKEIRKKFAFFTERQIKFAISNLEKQDILIKANYNQHKFDRTNWYSFKSEEEFLQSDIHVPPTDIHVPPTDIHVSSDGTYMSHIKENKHIDNTDNKSCNNTHGVSKNPFQIFLSIYPKVEGQNQNTMFKSFQTAMMAADSETIIEGVKKYATHILESRVPDQYIKNPNNWLAQRCWEQDYKSKKSNNFNDKQRLQDIKNDQPESGYEFNRFQPF